MTPLEALLPAIIYLSAGLGAAFASRAARISPIVGYLLAGIIIGPHGFGLVADNETTHFLAELGVAFMLFDIGLHFSLKEIRTRRDDILLLAPLQLGLCGLVFAAVNLGLGYRPEAALIVGASIALSSTAVVGKILVDRRQPNCPIGRSATAVLVAQDIVAIFILAFAASLSGEPEAVGQQMLSALLWAILSLGVALLAGRLVVRPLFRSLARTHNEEAFTAIALLVVLAGSLATASVGLSITLGAFLAGMAMSDTSYRHVVQSEVKPFQGLLLGLFFISAGMGVDIRAVAAIWPVVLLTASGILILKTIGTYLAARIARWPMPGAAQLAFLLSQGSEFTLVVLGVPAVTATLPAGLAGVLVAAVAITIAVAPLWSALGVHTARLLAARAKAAPAPEPEGGHVAQVLIYGMTREARLAADALTEHGIPYMGVDSDPERFVAAASDGYQVVYGDLRDIALMNAIGANRARAIVIGASQLVAREATSVMPAGGSVTPPDRFVAVETQLERTRCAALGFRAHIGASEPRGVVLAADLLGRLGVSSEQIASWIGDQADRLGILEGRDSAA